MIKVSILGAGNVATHLFRAFTESPEIEVQQVYNHRRESLEQFTNAATITDLKDLKPADVILISLKDDLVSTYVEKLQDRNELILHTSGSVPLQKTAKNNGVFYPLQTFSKQEEVNFKEVPLCLEADSEKNYQLLEQLAKLVSDKIYPISSTQRKSLHLSAVFVCNFVNHLYQIGEDLCEQNQVPFEILHALMTETTKKATHNSPKRVQTGPAIRNDQKTISSHLAQLDDANFKEIYKLLTQSIQRTHGKKL
ncbi:Rossmann-like and DUF2520 domain-containing protein [Mesonia sp. K7]|uniref:Rossmann-like and DUF2520 domain-containing protein n=1 Tax=Mesonia sp. K7 TaxID=2218606 RepID=UPI000DA95C56|nr:DUF2520 domain-containing protein [Mesonia sp. K7]PZD79352.1 DUF2520 domain-containing protein [Mesonia sp. K7]